MIRVHTAIVAGVLSLLSPYSIWCTDGRAIAEMGIPSDPPPALQSLINSRRGQLDAIREEMPELFERVEPYLHLDKAVKAPTQKQIHIIDYWAEPLDVQMLAPQLRQLVDKYPALYSNLKDAAEHWLTDVNSCDLAVSCFEKVEAEYRRKLSEIQTTCACSREEFQAMVTAAGPHKARGGPDLDVKFLPAWEAGLLRADVAWDVKQRLYEIVLSFRDRESIPTLIAVRRMAINDGISPLATSILYSALIENPGVPAMLELADIVQREGDSTKQVYRVSIGGRLSQSAEWKSLLDRYEADSRALEAVRTLRDVIRVHGNPNGNP